ncbi:Bromodomain Testis-Specific Protein [Manis pentadactyla]|nr:Bromodomain Testis-Specific Protein [Manis pentadactyla]
MDALALWQVSTKRLRAGKVEEREWRVLRFGPESTGKSGRVQEFFASPLEGRGSGHISGCAIKAWCSCCGSLFAMSVGTALAELWLQFFNCEALKKPYDTTRNAVRDHSRMFEKHFSKIKMLSSNWKA